MKSLTPGQIHYLYFWVHPQWDSPWTEGGVDREIETHRDFVSHLKDSSAAGLIQIDDAPREEFSKSKVYQRFIRKLKSFDRYAKQTLEDRYLVWGVSRFIDARNPQHVKRLVDRFNLVKQDQENFVLPRERWATKDPKYLAKISVFGKEVDTCPLGQATLFHLNDLASIVRYYSQQTPGRIYPPTETNRFPGDGEAVYIFSR